MPEQLEASVDQIYQRRFPPEILARRQAVWQVLCRAWFGRYIPEGARVLEIAPGYCEFINNVASASERVGVDLNPDTQRHAAPGVVIHLTSAEDIGQVIPAGHFDIAFMSNFLEHCRTRDQVLAVLRAVHVALRPGGRVLILGPNYRYCFAEYFDYFDHYLPLSEKAVEEALHLANFEVEVVQARTLPYTFRNRLPSAPWIVDLYLKMPWLWGIFGKQFFLVGRRPHPSPAS